MFNKKIILLTFCFMILFCTNIFAESYGTVRVNFYDADNSKEIDFFTKRNLPVGEEYVFEVDRFLNADDYDYDYTFSHSTPSARSGLIHVDIDEAITYEINIYYTKDEKRSKTLTVSYYNVDTNKVIDTFTVKNLYEDDMYTFTVKNLVGYTFDYSNPPAINNKISKSISYYNNRNTIAVYYRPNSTNSGDYNGYDYNRNNASSTDTYYLGNFGSASTNYITHSEKGIPLTSNTNTQFAKGYDDGTFRPDNYITRGEVVNMFYLIVGNYNFTNYSNFYDVGLSSPYYDSVTYFSRSGIINGYDDNTFRPNSYITREEFITIATKITGFTSMLGGNYFSDISTDRWSYPYINAGKSLNLINGYSDGEFKPTNYITRAEATKIISSIIKGSNVAIRNNIYSDVSLDHWAYTYIVNSGL